MFSQQHLDSSSKNPPVSRPRSPAECPSPGFPTTLLKCHWQARVTSARRLNETNIQGPVWCTCIESNPPSLDTTAPQQKWRNEM